MPRIVNSRLAYDGYAKVTLLTLTDDTGEEHNREVVSFGESACVLPYDPERRVALVVRLPRAPLLLAGVAANLIEAPAGMIEGAEGAEAAIRREAMEEAGAGTHGAGAGRGLLALARRARRTHSSFPRSVPRRGPRRTRRRPRRGA